MRTVSKLFSQPNFSHDRLSSFLSRSGCNNYTKAVITMTMITMTVMTAIMTLVMMTMYSLKRTIGLGKLAHYAMRPSREFLIFAVSGEFYRLTSYRCQSCCTCEISCYSPFNSFSFYWFTLELTAATVFGFS